MVKGSGNSLTTPEIVLGMMKELVVPSEDVEALSYVAIADGHKRHNMAKVYAGFYEYDNNTVEMSKQQRVPMMLVAKVGNPSEINDAKPGNRGKRDSQIVLMSFLQKVMFDERMTTFEYEFFNSMWRCTGVSPDRYETVLMVSSAVEFEEESSRIKAHFVLSYASYRSTPTRRSSPIRFRAWSPAWSTTPRSWDCVERPRLPTRARRGSR
jgi:chitin synthase